MSTISSLLVVAAALVDPHNRILLAQRPQGKMMAGMWEFPGGKVEANESPEQALIRELKEEIGVTLEEKDLQPVTFASHAYDTFHLVMPLYLVRRWRGDPQPLEGQLLKWSELADIDVAQMPPPDGPLIERICEMVL